MHDQVLRQFLSGVSMPWGHTDNRGICVTHIFRENLCMWICSFIAERWQLSSDPEEVFELHLCFEWRKVTEGWQGNRLGTFWLHLVLYEALSRRNIKGKIFHNFSKEKTWKNWFYKTLKESSTHPVCVCVVTMCFCSIMANSNSCMFHRHEDLPRYLCIGVLLMVKPAQTAAWPETPTVLGMERAALLLPPLPRGLSLSLCMLLLTIVYLYCCKTFLPWFRI